MPQRRMNICCGCGRSRFWSRSRESINEFISPTDLISQQRWNGANQVHSHRVQLLCSLQLYRETLKGIWGLGERKYWCNKSEFSEAQISQLFSRGEPCSLPPQLLKKSVKSLEAKMQRPPLPSGFRPKQKAFSSQSNDSLTFIGEAPQQHQQQETWCFSRRGKSEKTGRWRKKMRCKEVLCELRRDSGSPVEQHWELLNVKLATLTTICRHD